MAELKEVDYIIVGQGLAGSAIAVELLRREQRILVVDRLEKGTSSRVAAGLITPLTGKGINPADRQDEHLEYAADYYHALEKQSGCRFFYSMPVVRIFQSGKEQLKWRGKSKALRKWASDTEEPGKPFKKGFGAVEMPDGAWLDTKIYLRVVRDILIKKASWREADFLEKDVVFCGDELVEWQGVTARKIILCQGAYGLSGVRGYAGWFSHIPHRSAKGEILSVLLDRLDRKKRYHGNGWLAPCRGGGWKVGASYAWDWLDEGPTDEGRKVVLAKLATWVNSEPTEVEVVQHEAAIRPIIRSSQPLVGFHPDYEQVGFFNGLGSKGALVAPMVAAEYADHLCGAAELRDDLNLACF